nr:ribosome biogenesis factor YjgA [endosymbiont of Ridgeia piscesae]
MPSKSQVKRELLALQQLGERLTRLSPEILRRMPLNNELQAALEEAKRIRSHGALRRHYRRLGKLLRHAELDAIQQVLDELDNKHSGEVNRFHALERWRERLIEGDSQVFGSFFAEYPGADRQRLRQLIQAARKEREAEKPPLAYRKLFKCLREIAGL